MQPLGGRNAIGQRFQRTETNWAVYFHLKHFTFIGHWSPGRRSHEFRPHRQCFYVSSNTYDPMSYEYLLTAIKSCEIYDEAEFDIFIDEISEAVSDFELSVGQKEDLIEQLLLNVEQQPNPEFTSWSFIHFIEWLNEDSSTNYNVKILKSLRRKPKYLTLLLTNRIINSLPEMSPDRIIYTASLKEVASNPILDEYIRSEANELYEYQLNNGKNR